MQVHQNLDSLPVFKNAVITIGTFDGVHTGHLQIIHQLHQEAKNINGETVIVTFHPHPRMIVSPSPGLTDSEKGEKEIKLLNTLNEKIELLQKQNVDHLVIVPFTKEFSEQSAEDYIKNFLVRKFKPHTIIIGYDHHFGRERKGNYCLLEKYQSECHYQVKEIPEHVLNQITISSTKIREAILNCDIQTANKFLGYNYFFEGEVVSGNKLGRTLGYPTANIEVSDANKLIPGNGIYGVKVKIDNEQLPMAGMMSIGVRPTIGTSKRTIEVNIFEFDKNIYGKKISVFLKDYLREEKKFNNLEELRNAMAQDKLKTLELFKYNE